MRLDDALSALPTLTPVSAVSADAFDVAISPLGLEFKQALNEVQSVRTVQAGDNLVGIVRQHAQAQGVSLTDSQTYRYAQSLATSNGMANANRIYPGQQLNLGPLTAQWQEAALQRNAANSNPIAAANTSPDAMTDNAQPYARPAPQSTAAVLSAKASLRTEQASKSAPALKPLPNVSAALPNRASNATIPKGNPLPNGVNSTNTNNSANSAGASILGVPHPVLDKTLDRAVSKGFIPANEKQEVYQKVLQMASKHGFAPDDFARMTLMESDGMNPKATNQRCHGIIQFCDGPARGAAAVGMASNPKSILNLSVYQQLHLADTYFQKAGLNKQQGNVPLDDLYLSVLQPAARSETRADVPLGIPGTQAGALYTDKNSASNNNTNGNGNGNAITRQSLIRGLVQNAQRVLGMDRAEAKRPDNRAQTTGTPVSQAAPPAAPTTNTSATLSATSRLQAQRVASYNATSADPTQLR